MFPSIATEHNPSAATRSDFFAALEIPRSRNQSIAADISPFVSTNAFLQSIIPALVFSRNSLTIAAVIAIMIPPNVFYKNLEFAYSCIFLIITKKHKYCKSLNTSITYLNEFSLKYSLSIVTGF